MKIKKIAYNFSLIGEQMFNKQKSAKNRLRDYNSVNSFRSPLFVEKINTEIIVRQTKDGKTIQSFEG